MFKLNLNNKCLSKIVGLRMLFSFYNNHNQFKSF